jgi:hypothetical protein
MRRQPTFALAAPMESPSSDVLLCLWLTRLWHDQLPTLLDPSFSCILLVLSVAVALAFVSFQLGANSFPMSNFSTVETRFILLLRVSRLLHKHHDLGLGHRLGRGFVSSKLDKICMMMTRLACNRAIESSYWRMDNNLDVGLLTGYVLNRLLIKLESMDLDTFSR